MKKLKYNIKTGERISGDQYRLDAITLAYTLLGTVLVRVTDQGIIRSQIVETEAYVGPEDKGCHAYGGRRTARTEPIFHHGGTVYVYLIYGMYHCLNVVASEVDKPEAVLIRAVAPWTAEDEELMQTFRQSRSRKPVELCNGPGRLCQALHIDKRLNGLDMSVNEEIWIEGGLCLEVDNIRCAPRINIDYAGEYAHKLWRFYICDNAYVSVQADEPYCFSDVYRAEILPVM